MALRWGNIKSTFELVQRSNINLNVSPNTWEAQQSCFKREKKLQRPEANQQQHHDSYLLSFAVHAS